MAADKTPPLPRYEPALPVAHSPIGVVRSPTTAVNFDGFGGAFQQINTMLNREADRTESREAFDKGLAGKEAGYLSVDEKGNTTIANEFKTNTVSDRAHTQQFIIGHEAAMSIRAREAAAQLAMKHKDDPDAFTSAWKGFSDGALGSVTNTPLFTITKAKLDELGMAGRNTLDQAMLTKADAIDRANILGAADNYRADALQASRAGVDPSKASAEMFDKLRYAHERGWLTEAELTQKTGEFFIRSFSQGQAHSAEKDAKALAAKGMNGDQILAHVTKKTGDAMDKALSESGVSGVSPEFAATARADAISAVRAVTVNLETAKSGQLKAEAESAQREYNRIDQELRNLEIASKATGKPFDVEQANRLIQESDAAARTFRRHSGDFRSSARNISSMVEQIKSDNFGSLVNAVLSNRPLTSMQQSLMDQIRSDQGASKDAAPVSQTAPAADGKQTFSTSTTTFRDAETSRLQIPGDPAQPAPTLEAPNDAGDIPARATHVDKLARQFGLSVEQTSKLDAAFKKQGVSLDTFALMFANAPKKYLDSMAGKVYTEIQKAAENSASILESTAKLNAFSSGKISEIDQKTYDEGLVGSGVNPLDPKNATRIANYATLTGLIPTELSKVAKSFDPKGAPVIMAFLDSVAAPTGEDPASGATMANLIPNAGKWRAVNARAAAMRKDGIPPEDIYAKAMKEVNGMSLSSTELQAKTISPVIPNEHQAMQKAWRDASGMIFKSISSNEISQIPTADTARWKMDLRSSFVQNKAMNPNLDDGKVMDLAVADVKSMGWGFSHAARNIVKNGIETNPIGKRLSDTELQDQIFYYMTGVLGNETARRHRGQTKEGKTIQVSTSSLYGMNDREIMNSIRDGNYRITPRGNAAGDKQEFAVAILNKRGQFEDIGLGLEAAPFVPSWEGTDSQRIDFTFGAAAADFKRDATNMRDSFGTGGFASAIGKAPEMLVSGATAAAAGIGSSIAKGGNYIRDAVDDVIRPDTWLSSLVMNQDIKYNRASLEQINRGRQFRSKKGLD